MITMKRIIVFNKEFEDGRRFYRQKFEAVAASVFSLIFFVFLVCCITMNPPMLSEGALKLIVDGKTVKNPILQIINSKKLPSRSPDSRRYRVILSDGKYIMSFAILYLHIKKLNLAGDFQNNSVIEILLFSTTLFNSIQRTGKLIIVIHNYALLATGCSKIGSPVPLRGYPISFIKEEGNNKPLKDTVIHPISSLNAYMNNWVVKARVVSKSLIFVQRNSRKLSINLLDSSGGIRAVAYKNVADKLYHLIELDKVYFISKCRIETSNKYYEELGNDYTIKFTPNSVIEECSDDAELVPHIQYKFVPINEIREVEGNFVDVVGVCKNASDLKKIGNHNIKRTVQLIDPSNASIDVVLFGTDAEDVDDFINPILAFKSVKRAYNGEGIYLTATCCTNYRRYIDIPEYDHFRRWFESKGSHTGVVNLSKCHVLWMTFNNIQLKPNGSYCFKVKGTVLFVETENAVYKACSKKGCNNQVSLLECGLYRCKECDVESTNFKYEYLLRVNVSDWTSNEWVHMFNSEAKKMLGISAQEVSEALEKDPKAFASIANRVHFKEYVFECRTNADVNINGVQKGTVTVAINPVDYKEYNAELLSKIEDNVSMNK
ncbi:replication protein A 70 kDa DNA-binding subunit-like isoform X2 [Agrilus planipennis]|uniref:Replication factor A protein 1 n=1 Tax=Agrilus planipennis TaxID=224129 RepID=A0A1W4XNT8_AGRPL|nr:replication protein A 70 kDa DNA-binding subunit-like isoform X2 [Agrilus planipennis]